jgi:hypothetical protein
LLISTNYTGGKEVKKKQSRGGKAKADEATEVC